MATNKQDDKALAEDQAFIQSLYDDLSDHKGADTTDQPSEQLDQRIIAAAHKAVATKVTQLVDPASSRQASDNLQALNQAANKRKKMAWYYPAAMAASVLLVVTIVNHQLNTPINPAYEAPLGAMDPMSRSEQSESLVAAVAEMDSRTADDETLQSLGSQQAVTEDLPAGESDNAFDESDQQLVASLQAPNFAADNVMKSRTIEQQSKAEMSSEPLATTAKPSAEAESVIAAAKVKQESAVKDMLLSKQAFNSSLSPTALSHEEYRALQAQSKQKTLYWLLQQENDSSYVIELFKTEQTPVFYRLNKNSFQLNKNSEAKRQPFAEITYIAEK